MVELEGHILEVVSDVVPKGIFSLYFPKYQTKMSALNKNGAVFINITMDIAQ